MTENKENRSDRGCQGQRRKQTEPGEPGTLPDLDLGCWSHILAEATGVLSFPLVPSHTTRKMRGIWHLFPARCKCGL